MRNMQWSEYSGLVFGLGALLLSFNFWTAAHIQTFEYLVRISVLLMLGYYLYCALPSGADTSRKTPTRHSSSSEPFTPTTASACPFSAPVQREIHQWTKFLVVTFVIPAYYRNGTNRDFSTHLIETWDRIAIKILQLLQAQLQDPSHIIHFFKSICDIFKTHLHAVKQANEAIVTSSTEPAQPPLFEFQDYTQATSHYDRVQQKALVSSKLHPACFDVETPNTIPYAEEHYLHVLFRSIFRHILPEPEIACKCAFDYLIDSFLWKGFLPALQKQTSRGFINTHLNKQIQKKLHKRHQTQSGCYLVGRVPKGFEPNDIAWKAFGGVMSMSQAEKHVTKIGAFVIRKKLACDATEYAIAYIDPFALAGKNDIVLHVNCSFSPKTFRKQNTQEEYSSLTQLIESFDLNLRDGVQFGQPTNLTLDIPPQTPEQRHLDRKYRQYLMKLNVAIEQMMDRLELQDPAMIQSIRIELRNEKAKANDRVDPNMRIKYALPREIELLSFSLLQILLDEPVVDIKDIYSEILHLLVPEHKSHAADQADLVRCFLELLNNNQLIKAFERFYRSEAIRRLYQTTSINCQENYQLHLLNALDQLRGANFRLDPKLISPSLATASEPAVVDAGLKTIDNLVSFAQNFHTTYLLSPSASSSSGPKELQPCPSASCPLSAQIIETFEAQESTYLGTKKITKYLIRVKPPTAKAFTIAKRYNDFYQLYQAIGNQSIPFPPKQSFGNLTRDFVLTRKKQLNEFLQHLLTHTIAPDLVIDFLQVPASREKQPKPEEAQDTSQVILPQHIEILEKAMFGLLKEFFDSNSLNIVHRQFLQLTRRILFLSTQTSLVVEMNKLFYSYFLSNRVLIRFKRWRHKLRVVNLQQPSYRRRDKDIKPQDAPEPDMKEEQIELLNADSEEREWTKAQSILRNWRVWIDDVVGRDRLQTLSPTGSKPSSAKSSFNYFLNDEMIAKGIQDVYLLCQCPMVLKSICYSILDQFQHLLENLQQDLYNSSRDVPVEGK